MFKLRNKKSLLAVLLTVSMLFTGNALAFADEEVSDNEAVVEQAAETTEAAEPSVEEVKDEEPEVVKEEKYKIEINQGFSFHVKKDLGEDEATYMSNFAAGKRTAIMIPIDAKDDDAAKEVTKNWKLYYTEKDKDKEEVTWNGSEFAYEDYYDEYSNKVEGKKMAYVSMLNGPSKGKYTFYLKDGDTEVAKKDDVDFFEVEPLNILAVPVNAYYSESANVKDDGSGGCPKDKVGSSVECGEWWTNWKGRGKVTDLVKQYLLDVYPVAEVNVEEGNVLEAGTSAYDMCTDDGQKKLWEEACKLQVKDRESGKDKYDIILAFVMYRQDKTGTGQGYTFGKPANIITLTDPDMLPTVAHEIAHCYDVGDEYNGGSYNYRVNDLPLGYTSKGRDKITSEEVGDSTEYMKKGIGDSFDENKYPWKSGKQYKDGLGDKKAYGKDKSAVEEDGAGSVISPGFHPFILSKKEFVHFAEKDGKVYPTISYMGSGYSGDDNYYFTTSVIWDHLFEKFMKKEKRGETASLMEDTVSDDEPDIYFDDAYREGDSRMVEVAGEIEYDKAAEAASVSGCEVDPMFSYDGDLSYMDYFDDDEKDIKEDARFVFAAIDKDGNVMKASDKEAAMTEFYGSNFNSATPAPKPVKDGETQAVDRRFQKFCEFSFDAPYPEGTDRFIIVKKSDYDDEKNYKDLISNNKVVLWSRKTPDKIVDGELLGASFNKKEFSFQWTAAAYDENDKATTEHLYTMLYYAPKGDDGELYFVEDGYYAKGQGDDLADTDFGAGKNGYASFSFDPSEFPEEMTDKAYVWIKVSDGVNGLDLYTDQLGTNPAMEGQVKEDAGSSEKTQVLGDTLKVTKSENGKVFSIEGLETKTGNEKITLNAGAKFTSEAFKNLDVMGKVSVSMDGKPVEDEKEAKKLKKLLKVKKKKGILTLKPYKKAASVTYTILLNEDKLALQLTVVNVGFDKALKKKKITALTGEGSTVSVNLVKFEGKKALTDPSDFLSAEWFIDKNKTFEKPGDTIDSKAGFKVTLSKDNRMITIANPGDKKKGSVKVMVKINGKKYSTVIKAKVPKAK